MNSDSVARSGIASPVPNLTGAVTKGSSFGLERQLAARSDGRFGVRAYYGNPSDHHWAEVWDLTTTGRMAVLHFDSRQRTKAGSTAPLQ